MLLNDTGNREALIHVVLMLFAGHARVAVGVTPTTTLNLTAVTK